MTSGKRWTVRDRHGNEIHLAHERWKHIVDDHNHPEMADYGDQLQETIRIGGRKQDSLNPQKYRYVKAFHNLVEENTHIVVIVLFRFSEDPSGHPVPNGYVVTAYQKEAW